MRWLIVIVLGLTACQFPWESNCDYLARRCRNVEKSYDIGNHLVCGQVAVQMLVVASKGLTPTEKGCGTFLVKLR